MPNAVTVANTSCLIGLDQLGMLSLLPLLYGDIAVPNAVIAEYGKPLPPGYVQSTVQNTALTTSLASDLGLGEAEAIALADEQQAARLILDDLRARQKAKKLGITVTGLLGVLLKGKHSGRVSAIRPLLDQLQSNHFHVDAALRDEVLRMAGE